MTEFTTSSGQAVHTAACNVQPFESATAQSSAYSNQHSQGWFQHKHQTASESAKALSSARVTGGPWSNWCEGRPVRKSSAASFWASSLICVLLLVKAAWVHACTAS